MVLGLVVGVVGVVGEEGVVGFVVVGVEAHSFQIHEIAV